MGSYQIYALSTLLLTGSTVYYAYYTKYQFFPILVYLYSSKLASMVIGNFFIFTLLSFGQLMKYIFFGNLTDTEKEYVQDNIKSNMMEILLLMTIFRNEISANFVFYVSIMLFFKIFHWMLEQRVNFMEQLPPNDKMTYVKLLILLLGLFLVDLSFITFAVYTIIQNGASIQILFGFEYALLLVSIMTISIKYAFVLISLSSDRVWERKGEYLIYLEFASNSFKMLIYNAFFGLLLKYYGFPLYMIRSVYVAWGKFYSSWIKLKKYRKAVAEMNFRFPDATQDDIQRVEGICIVCREEMHSAKKLPCQHIMHKHCLTTYLESSLNCPLCRAPLMVEDHPHQPNQQIFNLLQQVIQNNNGNNFNNLNLNNLNLNNLNFNNNMNIPPNNLNNVNFNNINNFDVNNNNNNNNNNNLNFNGGANVNDDFSQFDVNDPSSLYDAIEKLQVVEQKLNNHEKQLKLLQNQFQFLQEFIMSQVENGNSNNTSTTKQEEQPTTHIINTKEDEDDNGKEDVSPVVERRNIKPVDNTNLNSSSDSPLDMNEIRRRRVMHFSGSQNLKIEDDEDN